MDLVIEGPTGRRIVRDFLSAADKLGTGGAGTVYSHPTLPSRAIKLYKTENDIAQAHEAKVRAMIARKPANIRTPDSVVQLAWPEELVLEGRAFRGFVMPQIDFKQAWTLQRVTRPTQRARHGIPDSLRLRLYAAINLSIVLKGLHEVGHHVIDLKPQNALVYNDKNQRSASYVALVDCDGFQIRGPDRVRHDAQLATPEFMLPKAAREHADGVTFDQDAINEHAAEQDAFALAIIIFQLLNESLHPMSGIEVGSSGVPAELGVRLFCGGKFYPYGLKENPCIRPDRDSIHLWFEPALRQFFDRAFTGKTRPPRPSEWADLLSHFKDDTYTCAANSNHWKLGDVCGICARDALLQPTQQVSFPVNIPKPTSQPTQPVGSPPKPYSMGRAWALSMAACLPLGIVASVSLALAGFRVEDDAVISSIGLLLGGGLLTFGLLRKWMKDRAVRSGRAIRPAGLFPRLVSLIAGAFLLLLGLELGFPVTHDAPATMSVANQVAPPPRPSGSQNQPEPTAGQIRDIQVELARLNLYGSRIDGLDGLRTSEAIAAFTRQQGLVQPALRTQADADRLLVLLRKQPSPEPRVPNASRSRSDLVAVVPVVLEQIGIDGTSLPALIAALNQSRIMRNRPVPWSAGGDQMGTVLNLGPMADRPAGCDLVDISRGTFQKTLVACRQPDSSWRL
jgi:peptidoglycan hydrolase-like protein with peptidoglycan-binding domain